jgi:hypothetical protein
MRGATSTAPATRLLQAAWVADDSGAAAAAIACRREAAERMTTHLAAAGFPVELRLRLIDVLRRARLFAEAAAHADAARASVAPGSILAAVADFQNKLIAAADTGRHTVDEIQQRDVRPG